MIPKILIAGLAGDSGKTIVSLSLIHAFKEKKMVVAPFKKGPDYIDSSWLGMMAGVPCRNLDTYMVSSDRVLENFLFHSQNSNIAIIEGNRGIFDGKDASGTHSTAELAKLLQSPVLLCVNATKVTRTVAAMVLGCLQLDKDVKIAGVILNQIAGSRHEKIIRQAIEQYCSIPVLGAIPKLSQEIIPERHLGLITPFEYPKNLDSILPTISQYLDIPKIIEISKLVFLPSPKFFPQHTENPIFPVDIGYFYDSAFHFYYPENLEALAARGAHLISISSLQSPHLPLIHALYIGGGFPETHAELLMKNQTLLQSVKEKIEQGLPVYAECGGLMYLCRSLQWKDQQYNFANVFPIDLKMNTKPAGHGYVSLSVDKDNPFFPIETAIQGHEFHYSDLVDFPEKMNTCMNVQSGVGLGQKRDGLVYKKTLATYTHIHAIGVPDWANNLVKEAWRFKNKK